MSKKGPEYPGYKAEPCNGCGQCCLTVPCSVSAQFGLWKGGKCRALSFDAGRYWCDVIRNPRRVSVRLSKIDRKVRVDAIGSYDICDHRYATSMEGARDLLKQRNAADEVYDAPDDTYPRSCALHEEDGSVWVIELMGPDGPASKQECVGGKPFGPVEDIEW